MPCTLFLFTFSTGLAHAKGEHAMNDIGFEMFEKIFNFK